MSEKILFYKVNEPYGVFSNFDRKHPIGVIWMEIREQLKKQKG
jgi:predicted NAD-dependent protein-ADP-ribosyltransferase YbiA (DUF1768 family)